MRIFAAHGGQGHSCSAQPRRLLHGARPQRRQNSRQSAGTPAHAIQCGRGARISRQRWHTVTCRPLMMPLVRLQRAHVAVRAHSFGVLLLLLA